ncbi:MAG: Fic family protein [Desulfobacterales bacterium]|nr:Fic family protein [Desulfobacterales bacterium]
MFNPKYTITPVIAKGLMRIEAVRQSIVDLPITPKVLKALRETARLFSTHYSTMIEGNELSQKQVSRVIKESVHFAGHERDEKEVLAYYAALDKLEDIVKKREAITETSIKTLHALVMGEGNKRIRPTPYRDGQNVIRDSRSGGIVYLPPESKDVSALMKTLIQWINQNTEQIPIPIIAAIAHYQFATIHPYYDGNGRTARLLTTLILHSGGYDLKGLYSLEEYYAKNLKEYYDALNAGDSHNYYMGRADADISKWIEYFIEGAAVAFEKVKTRAQEAAQEGAKDKSKILRTLDARQRKALSIFQDQNEIRASDIGKLFKVQPRTATAICQKWIKEGFIIITDYSRKARKYSLAKKYKGLID